MTLPWSKLPRSLAGDPRWLLLSPEGACAYLAARLIADDAGALWCVGDRDPSSTLAAIIATRRPGDAAWALRAVEECVDAGLLDVEGETLRVVDWLDGAPQEPTRGLAMAAANEDAAPTARRPGRPRSGDAPTTGTERKRRARFEARKGMFRDVPAGVSFEEWTAAKLPTDGRETRPRNSDRPRNSAAKLGRETRAAARASDSGEIENTGKDGEKLSSGARESGRETPDDSPRNSAAKLDGDAAKLPTAEALSSFDPLDVLDRMRKASGDRLATNLHTSTVAGAFATLARDLIAREVTTADGLVKAAAHVAHDPWVSAQGRLPLARLMDKDGKILLDLIAGSTGCGACGSPMASGIVPAPVMPGRRAPEPLAVDRPVMAPDEAKVVVGSLAAQWRKDRGMGPIGGGKVAGNG